MWTSMMSRRRAYLGLREIRVHGHEGARELVAGALGALQRRIQQRLLQLRQLLLPLRHELIPHRLRKLT